MKIFIKNILYFIIPLLIVILLFDFIISKNLSECKSISHGEMGVWNDIYKRKIKAEIAVYGSSVACFQVNSGLVKKETGLETYNFGIEGHNFFLQYLRHKLYMKYNKKPKFIIYIIEPYFLSFNKELFSLEQFLPNIREPEVVDFTSQMEGLRWYDYFIPLIRYYGKTNEITDAFKNIIGLRENSYIRKKGFYGQKLTWDRTYLTYVKSTTDCYKKNIDIKSLNLFKKFISECKKDKIKLFFISPPVQKEGQSLICGKSKFDHLIKNIALKNKITYIDYFNDSICNDTNLFFNARHLNYKGANIFTHKIILDINKSLK